MQFIELSYIAMDVSRDVMLAAVVKHYLHLVSVSVFISFSISISVTISISITITIPLTVSILGRGGGGRTKKNLIKPNRFGPKAGYHQIKIYPEPRHCWPSYRSCIVLNELELEKCQ